MSDHRLRYRDSIIETRTIESPPRPPTDQGTTMHIARLILCATLVLTSTTLANASAPSDARQGAGITVDAKNGDGPEHVAARQQAVPKTPHILSTNRWSEMMMKDDAVYLQLTDYGMKQVGGPEVAKASDEGFLGNILKTMALSGVKQLLNHSLALSLTDMRSALVRDGEVILVTCQGKEVFNKVKINDQVQKFSQDQADDFARSVNRQRAKLPACGK